MDADLSCEQTVMLDVHALVFKFLNIFRRSIRNYRFYLKKIIKPIKSYLFKVIKMCNVNERF